MDRWLCAGLFGFAISFTLGKPIAFWQWLLASTLVVVATFYWPAQRRHSILLGCLLCGIGWGSGNAYFSQNWQIPPKWQGQHVTINLVIEELPQHAEDYWRLAGTLTAIDGEAVPSGWLQPSVKVRLNWYEPTAERLPQAGETWQLQVKLRAPQGVRNEGGFLYHRYLLSHGIVALGSIKQGHYVAGRANLRQRLFNRIAQLQLSQGGILAALLVGERQLIPIEQWQAYQRTGLAHLIAISGLHLSLVAGFVLLSAKQLGRRLGQQRSRRERLSLVLPSAWLALLVALGYAYLAGFATATTRAFAMLLVVLLHKQAGLYTPPSRVLLRAVALVCLVEPLAPLQPGFWLSVLAVASILFMQWRWLPAQGKGRAIRMLWRLEWVLTLLLWPLTLVWFGGLPLLAPVTNLLLVPVFSLWVLPLALLALLAMLLQLSWLSELLLRIAQWPIELVEPVLLWLAQQPWQWLAAEHSAPLELLLVGLVCWFLPLAWYWRLTSLAALLLVLAIQQQLVQYQQHLWVHVLDVEQGSAVVIERQGFALLVDVGARWPSGGDMAERVLLPFLQQRRLTPELAFISHTDSDHRGGSATVKARYPQVRWFGSNEGSACVAGQQGHWRGVHWQVLHPRQLSDNQHNDQSCVLKISYGALQMLLPGDISTRAERQLLAQLAPVEAEVLVLAHHGSNSSSESYFLQAVKPSISIASRGRNNAYGMVSPAVKERLQQLQIPLLDTAMGGQISIYADSQQWYVQQPYAAAVRPWFDADN
ncbi:DNA internalization-related competence protein ComEC/Rec2 [Pseudidiomarina sp. PP-1MA]|uniref:DNA internalization-related competence protein ComEC/Rec2 n=1 Tax=Pseudidiomarina sp. PP-1MA TaxID=3237706 RepID=A0AB39X5P6_9GAMM